MGKKVQEYGKCLHLLQELKRQYPTYTLGQHMSTALSDYGDIWGLTDKEIFFALEKYRVELEFNIAPEEDVDKVVRDAQDLDKLLNEEEEEDGY